MDNFNFVAEIRALYINFFLFQKQSSPNGDILCKVRVLGKDGQIWKDNRSYAAVKIFILIWSKKHHLATTTYFSSRRQDGCIIWCLQRTLFLFLPASTAWGRRNILHLFFCCCPYAFATPLASPVDFDNKEPPPCWPICFISRFFMSWRDRSSLTRYPAEWGGPAGVLKKPAHRSSALAHFFRGLIQCWQKSQSVKRNQSGSGALSSCCWRPQSAARAHWGIKTLCAQSGSHRIHHFRNISLQHLLNSSSSSRTLQKESKHFSLYPICFFPELAVCCFGSKYFFLCTHRRKGHEAVILHKPNRFKITDIDVKLWSLKTVFRTAVEFHQHLKEL